MQILIAQHCAKELATIGIKRFVNINLWNNVTNPFSKTLQIEIRDRKYMYIYIYIYIHTQIHIYIYIPSLTSICKVLEN